LVEGYERQDSFPYVEEIESSDEIKAVVIEGKER
jgi:hypothetical protein